MVDYKPFRIRHPMESLFMYESDHREPFVR